MRVTIDIDEKYDEFLKELMECGGHKDVNELMTAEVMEVIHANLRDYSFDEEGNKFYVTPDGGIIYEEESLNEDPHQEARDYYYATRGV